VALLATLAITSAQPTQAKAGCKFSTESVRSISKKKARTAIKCLINKERSPNTKLRNDLNRAAQSHSATMAARHCLSHQCPGEAALPTRVARTGYLRGSRSYELGEIVLNAQDHANSRQIVRKWLGSPSHTATMKKSSFDHVGVGIARNGGLVYATADFGRH
jgi:uncharacterized protein YkwD